MDKLTGSGSTPSIEIHWILSLDQTNLVSVCVLIQQGADPDPLIYIPY